MPWKGTQSLINSVYLLFHGHDEGHESCSNIGLEGVLSFFFQAVGASYGIIEFIHGTHSAKHSNLQ